MLEDEKACPLCGETIKKVAVRCKHCHADLAAQGEPDFDRGQGQGQGRGEGAASGANGTGNGRALVRRDPAPLQPPGGDDFEQRFLAFAYQTQAVINAASVAFALKIPIADAEARLEDLAASDVLVRLVDNEGFVFYRLPGQSQRPAALIPRPDAAVAPIGAPQSPQALAGLLLNLVIPGVGSIVAGRTVEGILQLILLMIALPLCFVLIGFPLLIATWAWALATGIRGLNAPTGPAPPQLPG